MSKVILKNITKQWGDVYGVKNVSLNIADREFLVLLGPSGCGKTTTMRMIAGLEEISEGEIFIGDRLVNDLEPRERDISMVFQNYGLYAHLSVYDNICFPLKVRKINKSLHQEKVMQAAKMVELEALLDRKPKELSGGQRQRVALARAIVREPNCFLMDEPLSNLDAKLRVVMRSEIKRLATMLKITTIYVTHDQIEAMTMADKIAVMNGGEIVQLGTPQEIYDRPKTTFVASFIGTPPMNLIRGKIEKQIFSAPGVKVKIVKKIEEKEVYLGIRSEDLQVKKTKTNSCIEGKIYSLEKLGNTTLVNIKIGESIVRATAPKIFQAKLEDKIFFEAKPSSFLVYDANSSKLIT
jgi:multiple sugar transport system ATP-binding protein